MKKKIKALFLALVWGGGLYGAIDFYVAPYGKDESAGTKDHPFATVGRAVSAMRTKRRIAPALPTHIYLADGVFEQEEPIRLTADDAGAPILFAALPGAHPVLSAGRTLSNWRIGKDGRSWTVVLPELQSGTWKIEQFYVNGERVLRPSLPRDTYFYVHDKPADTAKPVCDRFIAETNCLSAEWTDLTDTVELVAVHGWNITRTRIRSYDPTTRLVTLTGGRPGFMRMFDKRSYYRLENVKAAFGHPGDWYADTSTGILSYRPRIKDDPSAFRAVAPRLPFLVSVTGDAAARRKAGNVTFRGLAFEYTSEVLPPGGTTCHQCSVEIGGAVTADYADGVRLESCAVRHTGGWAVKFGAGCEACAVVNCELSDLGAGGVVIGTKGAQKNQPTRYTRGCTVERCRITGGGRVQAGATGVCILMAGDNRIAHNTIHDFYYSGISVGYCWGSNNDAAGGNLIEWNHVYDLGQNVLSDLAAVYTLGRQPGTIIRNNLLHDITTARYGAQGLYFDEGSANITASNNIIVRAEEAAFSIAPKAGGNIRVENNICLFPKRYMIWTFPEGKQGNTGFIARNIFQWDESLGRLFPEPPSSKLHFTSNIWWQAAWPEQIAFRRSGGTNIFALADAGEKSRWPKWQKLVKPSDDVAAWFRDAPGDAVADPRLYATYAAEQQIKPMPDSPAVKRGFVPFDLSAGVGHEIKTNGYARPLPTSRAARTFPPAPLRRERLKELTAETDRGSLRMTVFNQRYLLGGAGFAVAFRTPAGRTFFFDLGNGGERAVPYSCGRDTIAPWLRANNIRTIDGIVVSHSHGDHFGGLLWMWDRYPVRAFWDADYAMPGQPLRGRSAGEYDTAARLRQQIAARNPNMVYKPVRQFDKLDWGPELDVTVITPPREGIDLLPNPNRPKNDTPEHHLINANALGIRVVYKDVVFQIMGDIQDDYEKAFLLPKLPDAYRKCDILLPCSHGINAAREEAAFFRPKVAIGSAYEDGAPTGWSRRWASKLGCRSAYSAVGSDVYVTGIDGNVTVSSDGKTFHVETEFGANRRQNPF